MGEWEAADDWQDDEVHQSRSGEPGKNDEPERILDFLAGDLAG